MARARNIKPSLFKNELLGDADPLLTILFEGLWCLADREGRLENRPKRIKAEIFPYRSLSDFNGYLTELARLGFIDIYEVAGVSIIQVINFLKHQSPHNTEKASELPENPNKSAICTECVSVSLNNESITVKESLIPDSFNLIPEPIRKARFAKPTLTDLFDEFVGRVTNPQKESEAFFNYYESNGWKVGKNPMKSWKHAVTNWINRGKQNAKPAFAENPNDTILREKYPHLFPHQ